jgi:hypothetical protein
MTAPESPPSVAQSGGRGRPWGWILLAAVLGAPAIGLGVYALQVNSDLDDAEAKIAEQEEALSSAQGAGDQVFDAIGAAAAEVASTSAETQADVAQLEQQVQAAMEWVRNTWGEGRSCPYCGDATWRAGMPVELRRPPGAGIAAAVPIICANCGGTVLLDTSVMGLAPEEGVT